ncbi:LacI family transcriptional regulator [Deinobacterium chartae]|uniref:LacI family transcriptional regulator n=1 Tax=Deinobacterium chartae TaxID=521158 RepID=A0A841HWN9_9DEIO|nr:substrate-binding domain-containing protein [Deinobacterium chartae]MBB6097273.1 LacI family transcriptional regulator [Deinobacterium chartae]
MEKPTIAHVAQVAGVSPSTVSRILNGTARVTPQKQAAVHRAIAQLGYQPNVIAQGLARGRSMSVGVLVQDISSPFFGSILHGIEKALQGSPYQPVFIDGHWRADQEDAAISVLMGRQVDALIIVGGTVSDVRLREIAAHLPLILLGRKAEGLERRTLRVNHRQGAYLAMRHLIDLGHTRIAHITGDETHPDARDRLDGYLAALEDARIPFDPRLLVHGDFHEASGQHCAEALLESGQRFSAIFVGNDQMAYGVQLALYRHGLRVPDDVSLVGFDDQPFSAYTVPPLTTVRQPTTEMGLAAGHAVLKLLEGEDFVFPDLEVRLMLRDSTARLQR